MSVINKKCSILGNKSILPILENFVTMEIGASSGIALGALDDYGCVMFQILPFIFIFPLCGMAASHTAGVVLPDGSPALRAQAIKLDAYVNFYVKDGKFFNQFGNGEETMTVLEDGQLEVTSEQCALPIQKIELTQFGHPMDNWDAFVTFEPEKLEGTRAIARRLMVRIPQGTHPAILSVF